MKNGGTVLLVFGDRIEQPPHHRLQRGRAQQLLPAHEFSHTLQRHHRLLRPLVIGVLPVDTVVDQAEQDGAHIFTAETVRTDLRQHRLNRCRHHTRLRQCVAARRHRLVQAPDLLREVGGIAPDTTCDLPQHQQIRIIQTHHPGPRTEARRGVAPVIHRVMTGMAVKQHQLGEQPVPPAGPLQQQQLFLRGNRLADGPGTHAVPTPLALPPVGVDAKVHGPDLRKRVEFETHARMARCHDFMGDHLLRVADMA